MGVIESVLIILLLVFLGVLLFTLTPFKPETIEVIELKELSKLWLGANHKKIANEPEKFEVIEKPAPEYESYSHNEVTGKEVITKEEVSRYVNMEDEQGIYKVFTLDDRVYLHTSALALIISERTGIIDKKKLKAIITDLKVCRKYQIEHFSGRCRKSLYFELPIGRFADDKEQAEFESRKGEGFDIKSIKGVEDEKN